MRITFYLFLCLSLFLGCASDPNSTLPHVNGYWEIEQVELANGQVKEYTYSQNIDYFELNKNSNGFRKKVRPKLDGTFETSNDLARVVAKIENDSLHLYYTNEYDSWKETVLDADAESLSIINEDRNIYTYKRHQPTKIDR
ncbi:lipocalin family protein [Sungkyunkwania multivorans]|uniref:Lipocalin family protein n=1 Tax=Sungkyunkwania multivorans TaxID=1173618 RepID=A0ABW3CW92_9FLAO